MKIWEMNKFCCSQLQDCFMVFMNSPELGKSTIWRRGQWISDGGYTRWVKDRAGLLHQATDAPGMILLFTQFFLTQKQKSCKMCLIYDKKGALFLVFQLERVTHSARVLKILVPFGRPWKRWNNNIKTHIRETGCEHVNWLRVGLWT